MSDALGDRMKMYEAAECGRRFMPLLPIVARIDGRCFSAFTRGMERPYDERMCAAMADTTAALVRETNACMGYTQSDEITLAWHSTDPKSQVWFDGRIHKMVSQLGALATLKFFLIAQSRLPDFLHREPTFDARVWQVPNRTEAANVFLWREWDCTKNSLTMAASEYYSHRELHEKNSADKHEMLHAKGVNWNDYPVHFKRGIYVQRRTVVRPFTADELDKLPPMHEARKNPALTVERQIILEIAMPIFASVENREAVIFEGAGPIASDGPCAHPVDGSTEEGSDAKRSGRETIASRDRAARAGGDAPHDREPSAAARETAERIARKEILTEDGCAEEITAEMIDAGCRVLSPHLPDWFTCERVAEAYFAMRSLAPPST